MCLVLALVEGSCKMIILWCLTLTSYDTTSSNHSVNQEMQIPRSSFVKTVNNLNASLQFRLFDIFNHLSTTPPIQQGLAAYISF